ncbi:uncharacterized protein N7477_007912 [Penicillium maclennaniae]|uniref:uncharacterized protein n=1 Tax=Penicillium maclennaniae TaxID=1343394 RepID=UPI0025422326|nr:uncharacterized protein N7477_007912 [Penicillium maclennaniae]KAJ5665464.1 hypothetical protein N7477_007912 [Penicillium maclennaniae]
MQYKTLAALLFATATVAQTTESSSSGSNDDYYGSDGSSDGFLELPIPPSSILAVLSTAIPTSWLMSMETDAAYASAEYSKIAEGTYPAWYNSLPESVKDWETSAAIAEASAMSSLYGSATPTMGSITGSMGATGASSTAGVSSTPLTGSSGSSTMVTSTMTTTTTTTSTTSTSSSDSSSSGSASTATTGGSSTSTAGAPAATGGIAMSLAGAAGILGLALAL